MYIRHLHIQNLKLLKDLSFSFTNEKGEPRMWTVIIGENGVGKTSILQAIAMAAAGGRNVNGLVENVSSLPDKRTPGVKVSIEAEFGLDARLKHSRFYPGHPKFAPGGEAIVHSHVTLTPGHKSLVARSFYKGMDDSILDPLDEARSLDTPLWFVAAYGIQRALPNDTTSIPPLDHPGVDRLRPIFKPVNLIGTTFANILTAGRTTMYSNVLRNTLFGFESLLPGFTDLEMRGQGGVRSAQ